MCIRLLSCFNAQLLYQTLKSLEVVCRPLHIMLNATIIICGIVDIDDDDVPYLYLRRLDNADSGRCIVVERALKRPDFSVFGKGLFSICLYVFDLDHFTFTQVVMLFCSLIWCCWLGWNQCWFAGELAEQSSLYELGSTETRSEAAFLTYPCKMPHV
jgi:hypothetical protein